jgi:hypothetical protein
VRQARKKKTTFKRRKNEERKISGQNVEGKVEIGIGKKRSLVGDCVEMEIDQNKKKAKANEEFGVKTKYLDAGLSEQLRESQ